MTKKIGSSLASWKSATLLALVAIIAAVALGGVFTTEAQDASDPALEVELAYVGGSADPHSYTATVTGTDLVDDWQLKVTATGVTAPVFTCAVPAAVEGLEPNKEYTAEAFAAAGDDTDCSGEVLASETFKTGVGVSEDTVEARQGQKVTLSFDLVAATRPDEPHRFRIAADSDADGSFSNGAQTMRCDDNDACDANKASAIIAISVDIADDSAVGEIFVERYTRGEDDEDDLHTINVSKATPAVTSVRFSDKVSSLSVTGGSGEITVEVKDGKSKGVDEQSVTLITTNGVFGGDCNNQQACSLNTGKDESGTVSATLESSGRAGSGTITAIVGTRTITKEVTFFGAPADLSAKAVANTIKIGDFTFVTATVTDQGGNAVTGATVEVPVGDDGPSGPEANSVVVVVAANNDGHDHDGDDDTPVVPDCGTGTNPAGNCVVKVSSSKLTTRGEHTIPLVIRKTGADDLEASATVTVAGAPESITHSDPGRVDALSTTKVTFTALDDEDVAVGTQAYTVNLVEGDGAVIGEAGNTRDGEGSFSYLAPTRSGMATLVIRIGEASAVVQIDIGPEPEEEPEAPPATWNNALVSGQNVVVWNGADGADPSEGDAEGVTAIWWYNNGAARWDGYFPDAAGVPGGNTLGSLSNGQAYVVIVN